MSKVVEKYLLGEQIGSGQYGKVFYSKNQQTGEVFAVKVIKYQRFCNEPKLLEFTNNEIETLSKIRNPNVISFIEMFRTANNVYLVYDFCNGGTLEELIKKRRFLPEKEAIVIFNQILNAFKTLFQGNILHRDLKPSNILLHDGVIKVADFGFCKTLLSSSDLTQTMVGSPIYMAPEILQRKTYNIKADIWSMGVVLFEMLFGFCPFEDRTISRLIGQIESKRLQIPKNINYISPRLELLLRKMLVVDPAKRIDWDELIYFKIEEHVLPSQVPKFNNFPSSNNELKQNKRNIGTVRIRSNKQALKDNTPPIREIGSAANIKTIESSEFSSEGASTNSSESEVSRFNQEVQSNNRLNDQSKQQQQKQPMDRNFEGIIKGQRISEGKKFLLGRIKILYQVNSLNQILELNENEQTTPLSFLFMKVILNQNEHLRGLLKSSGFQASGENNQLYAFSIILQNEIDFIQERLLTFQARIEKLITSSQTRFNHSLIKEHNTPFVNFEYLRTTVVQYVELILQKYQILGMKFDTVENTFKIALHVNEVLNSFLLDEYFSNTFDQQFNDYQNPSRIAEFSRIQPLINYKLELAYKKQKPVNRIYLFN